MAAETLTLTSTCAGGEHLTFSLTGTKTGTVRGTVSEMVEPITDDDLQAFTRVIIRLARASRTQNQTRTLLQNGVTITV